MDNARRVLMNRFADTLLLSRCALCGRDLHRSEIGGPWKDAGEGYTVEHCSLINDVLGPKHISVHDLPDTTDREALERWLDS